MLPRIFMKKLNRIFSNENEKRFAGHPVHYLISAGDKAAADDMLEVLIPSLLKNERLLSSRVYDVQKITDKAGRDENFANVFEAAQGGTVVLNLEGEKILVSMRQDIINWRKNWEKSCQSMAIKFCLFL